MIKIRGAKTEDIDAIQKIKKEYYGFCVPKDSLLAWINSSYGNFLVIEEENIVGFIFFEFVDKFRAIPFIHEPIKTKGDVVYVSEVGILDQSESLMQKLVEEMIRIAKKNKCNQIAWLTGEKNKHDKIELSLLKKNGFIRPSNVQKWEASPGHLVSDHWLWLKSI